MTDPSQTPTPPVDRDPEDQRAAPPRHPVGPSDGRGTETPGDLSAADIVGPTGEEMPVQAHDDVDGDAVRTRDRSQR